MERRDAELQSLDALEALEAQVGECLSRDQAILRRRLKGLRRVLREGREVSTPLAALRRDLERSRALRQARLQILPAISYPPELPISQRRAEIAEAISRHQVVVICGETGSGKTTQIPKICLELGRGVDGAIGHTQPRRIAARSVAGRIASELGTALGQIVGYQVRFDERADERTLVKVMTDGILLAELARDPELRRYDTIIIDEAHERSLNIDLLIGVLKRLLTRRPELKVVITSATIDPKSFSAQFDGAPVIEVSGRAFPVEVRWRPPPHSAAEVDAEREPSLADAVVRAARECQEHGPGDILVFLSGEREIQETAEAMRGAPGTRDLEILPLFSRLSASEQDRVFVPSTRRRAILATNVAETSLTVPGIRFVIDSGLARIARYSGRSRVQRLLIEPISRASAEQRKGRCGRIGPGLCIRLYSEEEFLERPEFTAPEILRTDLAGVVLRMKSIGLGDPETFPFMDPPSPRLWQDGLETLLELGALDRRMQLTPLGRRMGELPIDPRASRMILASIEERCLEEILVIAAALSVQDPRERPAESESAADAAQAAFRDPGSDFVGFLNLWRAWQREQESRGSSAMKRWCREHFLSARRLREWSEVHGQLRRLAMERASRALRGDRISDHPDPNAIHRAILAGLVSHVGQRQDEGDFQGPLGARFAIHPSSVLARKTPHWIVAAEIVETGRRWARVTARIQSDWVERVAPHLVQRSHSEPHWLPDAGQVAAWEKVSYGSLVVVPRRRVPYGPIDPAGARDIFIHAGLVDEQLRGDAPFLAHNRALRQRVESLESKRRERGLLVDVEARFRFYDARIPSDVCNTPSFESWRKGAERTTPRILFMREEDLLQDRGAAAAGHPDRLATPAGELDLVYRHEPGADADGVTVRVPLETLERLDPEPFEWLVPGMLAEKVEALIRALPKRLRTRFIPVKDFAVGAAEHLERERGRGSLRSRLASYLGDLSGLEISGADFDPAALPAHLAMRFEVFDGEGRVVSSGRLLGELQRSLHGRAAADFDSIASQYGAEWRKDSLAGWSFGELPERVELGPRRTPAFPAVVDQGAAVGVRLFPSAAGAAEAMRLGLRRLATLDAGAALRHHVEFHPQLDVLAGAFARFGPREALVEELVLASAERAYLAPPLPRDADSFERRIVAAAPRLFESVDSVLRAASRLLGAFQAFQRQITAPHPADWDEAIEATSTHAAALVHARFLRAPAARLDDLATAMETDLERLLRLPRGGIERDREGATRLAPWVHRAHALLGGHPPGTPGHAAAESFFWMVEAFRSEIFAAHLRRGAKVTERMLEAQWKALE